MRRGLVRTSVHAGLLVAVAAVLAWVAGAPFVFPSLGPSAYVLATVPDRSGGGSGGGGGDENGTAGDGPPGLTARRVVGGHAVGVVAGLLAYHAIAPGLVITTESPALAAEQARLGASGVLAVAGTTAGMLGTETTHPPACATTLIVSLGLLPRFVDGCIIVVAVIVLYASDVGIRHVARRVDAA